jgi:hypothetical protein
MMPTFTPAPLMPALIHWLAPEAARPSWSMAPIGTIRSGGRMAATPGCLARSATLAAGTLASTRPARPMATAPPTAATAFAACWPST